MCESSCSRSRTSWPRPRIGSTRRRVSGSSMNTRSICSSTFAVRIESDSMLGSSGENAGSDASEPSAVCSSPVTSPSARTRSSSPSGSLASSSSTSSQPSRAPARNSCRIPSVASTSRPSKSYQPASGAMFGNPRADRKRSSSSSGFSPGSTRRNAFRISESPNTIEELDCSTPTGRTSTVPPRPATADARPVEAEHALVDRHLGVRAHAVQQLAPERGVGERVVDRPAVGGRRSRARPSPRRPAAGRAAPGRSRACRRRSAPRSARAPAAAPRCAAGRPPAR